MAATRIIIEARGMARLVQAWLIVLGLFVIALKGVDRLPALLTGTPHSVRVFRVVADAERAVGAGLWMPAYYPDTLAWPPDRVDVWAGPPDVAAVHVSGRTGEPDRLVVVQSLGTPAPTPEVLLSPIGILTTVAVPVGDREGLLTRGVTATGDLLHEIAWNSGSRRVTLRYHGPVEELLLMAASLERVHR